jgi:hypothetical protein
MTLYYDLSKESIKQYFPESIRGFLSSIDNPMDESEVLIKLFADKDVRISGDECVPGEGT